MVARTGAGDFAVCKFPCSCRTARPDGRIRHRKVDVPYLGTPTSLIPSLWLPSVTSTGLTQPEAGATPRSLWRDGGGVEPGQVIGGDINHLSHQAGLLKATNLVSHLHQEFHGAQQRPQGLQIKSMHTH